MSSACAFASSAILGAALVAPGEGAVHMEAGLDAVLPTVGVSLLGGAAPGVDVGARYATRAGLAHDFALAGRVCLAERWAASLEVGHGFFAVEEIGGIEAVDAPFGNAVVVAPAIHRSGPEGRPRISWTVGARLEVAGLEHRAGAVVRTVDPGVQGVFGQVAAEWPVERGAWTLRLRALVPLQQEFRVVGYLPWVVVGRSWRIR